ncbi:MAG: hypothetical protein SWH68_01945 [Thermodesulfobacteriota bacterium]|nr:hypothetical protein [Thermodesulfobacteriota bacterium]
METINKAVPYECLSKKNKQEANGTCFYNVAADKNLMIQDGTYDFFSINLNNTSFSKIKDILAGCEEIENECWNAQEAFAEYAAKSDFLYYSERDGVISGFFLVSFFIVDQCCIISMDEIMVRNSEQGKKLGLKLALTAFRDFANFESGNKKFKSISLMSITPNKKIMNSYFKGSLLTNLKVFDSTFNPSTELKNIHKKCLKKVGYSLVQDTHPFFIKNVFPGSNKMEKTKEKEIAYNKRLQSIIPDDFDPVKRGDSLCFMLKTNRIFFSIICLIFMQKTFGFRFWMTKRLGIKPFYKRK